MPDHNRPWQAATKATPPSPRSALLPPAPPGAPRAAPKSASAPRHPRRQPSAPLPCWRRPRAQGRRAQGRRKCSHLWWEGVPLSATPASSSLWRAAGQCVGHQRQRRQDRGWEYLTGPAPPCGVEHGERHVPRRWRDQGGEPTGVWRQGVEGRRSRPRAQTHPPGGDSAAPGSAACAAGPSFPPQELTRHDARAGGVRACSPRRPRDATPPGPHHKC